MKLRILSVLILLISIFCKNAQSQITFQKIFRGIYDSYGFSARPTFDNGYIVTGFVQYNPSTRYDLCLIKTNENGDTLWTKVYGGPDDEVGYSVQQTRDSGYIVAGYSSGFDSTGNNVYLVRTEANGDTLWTKIIGGLHGEYGYSVEQTWDDGFIITGSTTTYGAGNVDVYLIKTDANGNLLWTKTFGGMNSDIGFSVQQTFDGGYIIAGSTESFGQGNSDVYVIRMDVNGDTLWTKTYGGTGDEEALAIRQTSDNGYIIAGTTNSFGAGHDDVYLIKTDSNGDTLWTKTYGGSGSDHGLEVQQTADGGYIIVGNTMSFGDTNYLGVHSYDIYLIKTDVNGSTLWTRTFGDTTTEYGYSVRETNDGGYIIAGIIFAPFGLSYIYLIKTDAFGNSICDQGSSQTISGSTSTIVSSANTNISTGGTEQIPHTIVRSKIDTSITFCFAVGLNEIVSSEIISVSPNPSTDKFLIIGTKDNGLAIIYDISGKEILRQKTFDGETEIKVFNLLNGIYILKYIDVNENKIVNLKLVKI